MANRHSRKKSVALVVTLAACVWLVMTAATVPIVYGQAGCTGSCTWVWADTPPYTGAWMLQTSNCTAGCTSCQQPSFQGSTNGQMSTVPCTSACSGNCRYVAQANSVWMENGTTCNCSCSPPAGDPPYVGAVCEWNCDGGNAGSCGGSTTCENDDDCDGCLNPYDCAPLDPTMGCTVSCGSGPCEGFGGDTDGDGVCDDQDSCPSDPNKFSCECGDFCVTPCYEPGCTPMPEPCPCPGTGGLPPGTGNDNCGDCANALQASKDRIKQILEDHSVSPEDLSFTGDDNVCWDFRIPMPGGSEQLFSLCLKPNVNTPIGAAIDNMRVLIRGIITILIWFFTFSRIMLVLRQD